MAIRPSTLPSVLTPFKKNFPSAKAGPWHHGPPKYAIRSSPMALQPPGGQMRNQQGGLAPIAGGPTPLTPRQLAHCPPITCTVKFSQPNETELATS
jgi:hypothetical protein